MTDGNDARVEHPDELLAGYADGSASPEERRAVQAHLVNCSQCREEMDLTQTARAALASLPQLEAPGIAAQGLGALLGKPDELAERRDAKRDAGLRRQWQVSWVAVAGVAAVLALFAVVPFVLNNGSTGTTAARPQAGTEGQGPAAAANYPAVLDRGMDYDQASLQALARRLGNDVRGTPLFGGTPNSGPAPTDSVGREANIPAAVVVRCAVQGTGLPAETVPQYMETAKYQGKPVYVVAVLSEGGSRSHLRVYAVGQQDCSFLYEVDQPI